MGCSKLTKLLPTFQNLDQLYTPLGQVIVLLESTKAQLSYPFIINEFTLKDSIDLVNWIQDSSTSLFKNGYKYVLFDVEYCSPILLSIRQLASSSREYIMTQGWN